MKTRIVMMLVLVMGVSAFAYPVGPVPYRQAVMTSPNGALMDGATNFFANNLSLMEQALIGGGFQAGSGNVGLATNAISAQTAISAQYASLATNAISAQTAVTAATATTATTAQNALTANLAVNATAAGYALTSGTATNTPYGPAGNLGTQNSNSVTITGGIINGVHSGNGVGLTNLPISAINVGSDSLATLSQVQAQISAATNDLGTAAYAVIAGNVIAPQLTNSLNTPGLVGSTASTGTNNFAANVNVGRTISAWGANFTANVSAGGVFAQNVNAGNYIIANSADWPVGSQGDQWAQYGGSNQDDSIYWDDFYGAGHTLQLSNNLIVVTGTVKATSVAAGGFTGSGAGLTNLNSSIVAAGANVTVTPTTNATSGVVTFSVASSGGGGSGNVVSNTSVQFNTVVATNSAPTATNNFAGNLNVGRTVSAYYGNIQNLSAGQINAGSVNAGASIIANSAGWPVGNSGDQWSQYGGSNADDSIYWDDFYGAGHTVQLSNNLFVVTGMLKAGSVTVSGVVTETAGITGTNATEFSLNPNGDGVVGGVPMTNGNIFAQNLIAPSNTIYTVPGSLVVTGSVSASNLILAPGGMLNPTNLPLNIYANTLTFTNGLTGVTNATPPANTTTIRVWINFTNTASVLFKLPGYQ